jgi:rod shape-determining protein MreC
VLRNGLRTIAVGTGRIDELKLPYLPTNSDVREGDLLVTSGLGAKFPPGYPVATVTRIDQSPDAPFSNVRAEPRAHLDRSREVLLVWTIPTELSLGSDAQPSDGDPIDAVPPESPMDARVEE